MIALKILDIKKFMEKLLVSPLFDPFSILSVDVKVASTWHLDGLLNPDYFSSDELELMNQRKYALWSEMKPHVFQLIKGKKTPAYLKIVFLLTDESLTAFAESKQQPYDHISSLIMNIKFDPNGLTITSGAAQKSFSFEKALELEWDQYLKEFLDHNEIAYE